MSPSGRLFAAGCLALALAAAPGPATAQDAQAPPDAAAAANAAEQARIPERIEIGLSTETIAVTSNFTGQSLTIFGAIDNVDPFVQRQGRYDIFVVLEGPSADLVTRRKGRVFGIWMNVESQAFDDTPQSYLVASTRPARDITSQETLSRLALGVGQIRIRPDAERTQVSDLDLFVAALRDVKQESGLYREFPGGVRFISQSLFRAELSLPANVPLGVHEARAYLFRHGALVGQTEATLRIAKAGFEFAVSDYAHRHSLVYGFGAVLLALFVGWLGRIMFKRD